MKKGESLKYYACTDDRALAPRGQFSAKDEIVLKELISKPYELNAKSIANSYTAHLSQRYTYEQLRGKITRMLKKDSGTKSSMGSMVFSSSKKKKDYSSFPNLNADGTPKTPKKRKPKKPTLDEDEDEDEMSVSSISSIPPPDFNFQPPGSIAAGSVKVAPPPGPYAELPNVAEQYDLPSCFDVREDPATDKGVMKIPFSKGENELIPDDDGFTLTRSMEPIGDEGADLPPEFQKMFTTPFQRLEKQAETKGKRKICDTFKFNFSDYEMEIRELNVLEKGGYFYVGYQWISRWETPSKKRKIIKGTL